ncbi:hypothetical protein D3C74_364920 [compost metagenome]
MLAASFAVYVTVYSPDTLVSTLATVALLNLMVGVTVTLASLLSVAVNTGIVYVALYATFTVAGPVYSITGAVVSGASLTVTLITTGVAALLAASLAVYVTVYSPGIFVSTLVTVALLNLITDVTVTFASLLSVAVSVGIVYVAL